MLSLDGFALAFETPHGSLRVTLVQELAHAPYSMLSWNVLDIAASAARSKQARTVADRRLRTENLTLTDS